jgi:chorismate mutase
MKKFSLLIVLFMSTITFANYYAISKVRYYEGFKMVRMAVYESTQYNSLDKCKRDLKRSNDKFEMISRKLNAKASSLGESFTFSDATCVDSNTLEEMVEAAKQYNLTQ